MKFKCKMIKKLAIFLKKLLLIFKLSQNHILSYAVLKKKLLMTYIKKNKIAKNHMTIEIK